MTSEIRIYVANLAKYNEGFLRGKWIDLPAADMWEQVREILGDDEEWAIHEYEAPISISEYADLNELNAIAEHISNEFAMACFAYLVNEGYDLDYAFQHYEDVTCYRNMNLGKSMGSSFKVAKSVLSTWKPGLGASPLLKLVPKF